MREDVTRALNAARAAAATLTYNVSAILQRAGEFGTTIDVPQFDPPLRPGPARVICTPPPEGVTHVSLEDLRTSLETTRELLQLLDRGLRQSPNVDPGVITRIGQITGLQL